MKPLDYEWTLWLQEMYRASRLKSKQEVKHETA
jgi:hypothetical protein